MYGTQEVDRFMFFFYEFPEALYGVMVSKAWTVLYFTNRLIFYI